MGSSIVGPRTDHGSVSISGHRRKPCYTLTVEFDQQTLRAATAWRLAQAEEAYRAAGGYLARADE